MKPLWPSILVAIATSSPLVHAQSPAAAPAPATGGSTPATPPAAAGDAAPPAPTPPADPAQPAAPAGSTEATDPATPESTAAPAEPASAPGPGNTMFAAGAAAAPPPQETPPPPAPAPAGRPRSSNRGHVRLGARAGLAAPFGMVAKDTPHTSVTGIGAGYGLDLSVGLAEELTLGAYGDLLILDRRANCAECAPVSYGLGLTVRYHLVQGLRFDPWASYGIGAMALSGVAPNGEGSYVGIEWMRLSFGGDWYALRNLGLGPYVELGAGSFWQAPAGEEPGGVQFRFQMGMRIVLDIPGR